MRLPIDTSAVKFVSLRPAEVDVDFTTKAPKTDEQGRTLHKVHLVAVGAKDQDIITVRVAGEPKGLSEFTPVKVHDLVATTWQMENRFGVSFRAGSIEAVGAPARQQG